jgi:hypothetical protein
VVNIYYTQKTGVGWAHLQDGQIKNTKENLKRVNTVHGSLPAGKPQNRCINAVAAAVRKLLDIAGWKILALGQKIW